MFRLIVNKAPNVQKHSQRLITEKNPKDAGYQEIALIEARKAANEKAALSYTLLVERRSLLLYNIKNFYLLSRYNPPKEAAVNQWSKHSSPIRYVRKENKRRKTTGLTLFVMSTRGRRSTTHRDASKKHWQVLIETIPTAREKETFHMETKDI